MKETLCWDCEKALGYCPWSERFDPVPGWNATPTKIPLYDGNGGYMDSFLVHECPMFVPDCKGVKITSGQIRLMLNVSRRTFEKMSDQCLVAKMRELGYELTIDTLKVNRRFVISRIRK